MTGRTATKIRIASAAPLPVLVKPNASWNIWLASTWDPNWPLVVTFTMSNTFITPTMRVVTTTPMVVAIWGSVTRQNTWLLVAPSIFAASISSVGTALMAAERMTMAKPVWIQMKITISQKLLYGVSCTKNTVSA